ncbi:MAG TPA: tetratricopeptide repeat protein, partial [Candidatus Nanopelagicales bacterium]|nr:tetratricopeptide repeat protein [Candidatus Nanopelagicales bacterium]
EKRPSSPNMPAMSMKERRELLARKLGGALRRPSSMTMQAVRPPDKPPIVQASGERQSDPGPTPESARAAEVLKARYDAARAEALRSQIERYLAMGRGALERKDFASAANAFRIAASLAPEDDEVQRECAEVQQLAAAALAEGYLKQAQYEETHERWEEAALSYAKVCAGRPDDPRPHERAAFTMLKAAGNTRRAVEFARRAVELSPDAPELRLTLARAYAVAGLERSATGELTRATELARGDAKIRELIAQARDQIRQGKPV